MNLVTRPSEDGRLYIQGELAIPRLEIKTTVLFSVDTGAQGTLLMPSDTVGMGLDYDSLDPDEKQEIVGVGGPATAFRERANLAFKAENGSLYVYRLSLYVLSPESDHVDGLPSTLGHDLLQNWKLSYAPGRGEAEIEVIGGADAIF